MRAALVSLAAFEVAIRGRGTTLAGLQLVRIHAQTHGAAGLAPFEAGGDENLVEAFLFGLDLHEAGARDDHALEPVVDLAPLHDLGDGAQIFDTAIGARA